VGRNVTRLPLRPCRERTGIERPAAPPWIAAERIRFPGREPWRPAEILAWRWINRDLGTRFALVGYSRDGLLHSHSVNGDLIKVPIGDVKRPRFDAASL
jgi:hypothetical protein